MVAGFCRARRQDPFCAKIFGFIFLVQCPSNNDNFIETLFFSTDKDASNIWLLRFPHWPLVGGAILDTLSNVRWFPRTNEVGEVFVDREDKSVCRFEGRWKLERETREPRLVFWRENKDCAGKSPGKCC